MTDEDPATVELPEPPPGVELDTPSKPDESDEDSRTLPAPSEGRARWS